MHNDSPAEHATELLGTGAGGAADVAAASAAPPPDELSRRDGVRRRLRRRIAEPSDVEIIAQRIADERRDDNGDWIVLTPDEPDPDNDGASS